MADTAPRHMTVEEFLQWDDGTDTRYELIKGQPTEKESLGRGQAVLAARVSKLVGARVERGKLGRTFINMAVPSPWSDQHCYVADIAATKRPTASDARVIVDPFLVVDLALSWNRRCGALYHYHLIPSMAEIVLLDPHYVFAEVFRRHDGNWLMEMGNTRDWRLKLETIGIDVALSDLYRGLPMEEPTYPAKPPAE
jgi:Uma2 family endonuclease